MARYIRFLEPVEARLPMPHVAAAPRSGPDNCSGGYASGAFAVIATVATMTALMTVVSLTYTVNALREELALVKDQAAQASSTAASLTEELRSLADIVKSHERSLAVEDDAAAPFEEAAASSPAGEMVLEANGTKVVTPVNVRRYSSMDLATQAHYRAAQEGRDLPHPLGRRLPGLAYKTAAANAIATGMGCATLALGGNTNYNFGAQGCNSGNCPLCFVVTPADNTGLTLTLTNAGTAYLVPGGDSTTTKIGDFTGGAIVDLLIANVHASNHFLVADQTNTYAIGPMEHVTFYAYSSTGSTFIGPHTHYYDGSSSRRLCYYDGSACAAVGR